MECVFSKRNMLGSNHLLQQIKQKKTESESKDVPRKTHSIQSNKNVVSWKMTWFLPMKKGCLGASPSFDTCTPWIFFGVTWASPSVSFFLYFISSFSFPYTWKLPSYKISHNSISNISVSIIVNLLFWFSFKLKYNTH
jgi:hypothetical protein